MAYTSVIPVRRLDRTVDYVQNKAKTTPKSLEEAVDYAANRDKTESACFETGLGCTTTSAFEDMRLNTLRWHKERHIRTGEEGYTAIVGQVYENNGRKASGYNIGKVFDITQTRGRPVPPPAEYQVDELIAASIESSPVPIQISDSLPDGIQAQYVPKNRTIYVRNGMDAGTTLCAIVRECAQADFHKDYTYNRQAYAAPSYCAAYMVAHRYGLDTAAFNFDRVVALYGNLGKEQQRGFLSDVNTVGGGLLRSLSRTLAVQTREPPTAEYAVAVPSAKKQSRQQERG